MRAAGRCLLLLDEVTAIANWDEAVKVLWDDGVIRQDIVVCTGSSAIDLRLKAAERWPGRRGGGRDLLALPYGFAAFARAVDPLLPEPPGLTISDLVQPRGREILLSTQIHTDSLARAFELYLRFGGLPAAVAEAVAGAAEPSHETVDIAYASMLKEVSRRNLNEVSAVALLERIGRGLSSKTNWATMAREMALPAEAHTRSGAHPASAGVREHIDTLAASCFLLVLYAWRADLLGNDVGREKKLYFADPLIATLAHTHVPGLSIPTPALVENVVALTLLRRYEPEHGLVAGFHRPSHLHFWSTNAGGEIDFVAGPRSELEIVECKYANRVRRSVFNGMRVAFGSRPAVVASRDELEWFDGRALVPAPLLCWALAGAHRPWSSGGAGRDRRRPDRGHEGCWRLDGVPRKP